jgi:hypothetical protein
MFSSISKALGLMSYPIVWMAGIYLALVVLAGFLVEQILGTYTATRVAFILFLLFPFAVGGVLGVLRYNDYSPVLFFMQAKKHYFGITIPAFLILLTICVTIILVTFPISLMTGGIDLVVLSWICVGVATPLFVATVFYLPAIVCEDSTVFSSLLRSLELISCDTLTALKFWSVSLVLQCGVFFSLSLLLASLAYEDLLPYAELSIVEQQEVYATFTLEKWMEILGDGALFLVIFGVLCVIVITTFLLCYLYVCYTKAAKTDSMQNQLEK